MTKKQYKRMVVFALRMVRVSTTPRWQGKLRELVADFLDRIGASVNGDYVHMLDWDHSQRYDYWEEFTWACGTVSRYHRKGTHALLCDEVTRFIWDMEDDGRLPRRSGFDDPRGESALAVKLRCCIRAAADVAVAPSAGVYGWTVGQLRDMWKRRKLPAWVTGFFNADQLAEAADDVPVWL